MILSIDPGDKRIGIARWSDEGKILFNEILSFEDYLDYLAVLSERVVVGVSMSYSHFIVEDWSLRQGKGQKMTGSKFLSPQCIGAAALAAKLCGAELVKQSPQILKVAAMHFGVPIPAKGHLNDAISAKLHGLYFLENEGILEGHGADLIDFDS